MTLLYWSGKRSCSAMSLVVHAVLLVPSASTSAQAVAKWRADPHPLLDLGGANDTGATQFTHIRGVMRLKDGTIIVADGGSSELRYFDRMGRHWKNASRRGSGPGEVRGFDAAYAIDDTVYAFDEYGPLNVYDHAGQFLRSIAVREGEPAGKTFGWPRAPLGGGTVAGIRRGISARTVSEAEADSDVLVTKNRVALSEHVLAKYPHIRTFMTIADPLPRPLGFTPSTKLAAFASEVCAGYTSRYEIVCRTPNGNITRTIVRRVDAVPVTARMRTDFTLFMSGSLPGGRSRYAPGLAERRERQARSLRFAERLPVFSRLLASRTGTLWICDSQPEDFYTPIRPLSLRPSVWRIFGAKGEAVGEASLPPGFLPYDVGADWVLGVRWDEDDVEHVTMFQLLR